MSIYIFIYFLGDDVDKVKENLGQHVNYWKDQKFDYYKNGPFADKTGGLIMFSSENLEKAQHVVSRDPLLTKKVIKQFWLKEWVS